MFKKNILILCLVGGLCLMQLTDVMAEFDPESTMFSQMDTLRTWVRTDISSDVGLLRIIQKAVAASVPHNPDAMVFYRDIINDEGITQHFGKTFLTLADIELPFLQHVHAVSKIKPPVTLEIAAGLGTVSWKVPYAFEHGGRHYVNELNSQMLRFINFIANTAITVKTSQGEDLKKSIIIVPGSCFDILNKHPQLAESVDVIYVQNLEHFLNPVQHAAFLEMIADLLAPNGHAFLCASSFRFGTDKNHPLYKLWQQQRKSGDIYHGFAEYDVESRVIGDTSIAVVGTRQSYSKVSRPQDDAIVGSTELSNDCIGFDDCPGFGVRPILLINTHIISNFFSPEIYRAAIAVHPRLEVVDAFFMDNVGRRQNSWSEKVVFAAAIIKKKSKGKSPAPQVDQSEKIRIGAGVLNGQTDKSGFAGAFSPDVASCSTSFH